MKVAKAAVVTGAAGGIGSALCEQLLQEGYTVWALDYNQKALEALGDSLAKFNRILKTRAIDITVESQIREVIETIASESHQISIWVNNAGVSGIGHFTDASTETLRRIVDVNLTAVITSTRLILEKMEFQGSGVIVNIASVAGHLASPYLAAYASTKHGVVGFTRSLEIELQLKTSGVRTLLVSPGFVETQMVTEAGKFSFPEWLSFCLATPQAVARAIVAGIRQEKREIFPSWNGKMLLALNKMVPGMSRRGSKLLVSKSLKDYFLNRFSA